MLCDRFLSEFEVAAGEGVTAGSMSVKAFANEEAGVFWVLVLRFEHECADTNPDFRHRCHDMRMYGKWTEYKSEGRGVLVCEVCAEDDEVEGRIRDRCDSVRTWK